MLALVVGGCPKTPAPAPLKTLTIGITSEPDTLNPLLTESGSAHEVIGLVWRDAVLYGPDWKTRPDLVESVPTIDDQLRVHWRIRQDALWEDGKPVVAQDFIVAWKVQLDESQEVVVGRDTAKLIESITPDDDNRGFTVKWREPYVFYAEPRVHRVLPAHIVGGGAAHAAPALRRHPLNKQPLSNGPFRLVEWQPGQLLRFARNDKYSPRAKLDEVIVKILPSTTAMLTALESGDIDAAFPSGGPSPVEVAAFVERNTDRFMEKKAAGQQWVHVDINNDTIKDPAVRRALAQALPRDEIVKAISNGGYDVAHSYLPPLHWGYDANLPRIEFNPDEAKKHLAGLKIQLAGASGSADSEKLVVLLADAWKRVGAEVTIDQRPFKVFFGEGVKKRKLPGLAVFAWTMDASAIGGTVFRKDRIPSEANGWKGNNTTGFVNDEITDVLTKADATIDLSQRKQLVSRAQQIVLREMPAIPLYFKPVSVVHRVDVVSLSPTGTMTALSWNAHAWDRAFPSVADRR